VCSTCNKGVKEFDKVSHVEKNHNGNPPTQWLPMTPEWVMDLAASATMEGAGTAKEVMPIPE